MVLIKLRTQREHGDAHDGGRYDHEALPRKFWEQNCAKKRSELSNQGRQDGGQVRTCGCPDVLIKLKTSNRLKDLVGLIGQNPGTL